MLSTAGHAQAQTAEPPGADLITDAQLREHLAFIASDLLEGRGTPSRGLDIAAAFLASHLRASGLTPAGDQGTYFQRIALTRRRAAPERSTMTIGPRALLHGVDFLAGDVPGSAEASVVYVGNGTVIASRGVDPYRHVDVRGTIVVSHAGLPAGFSHADLVGPRGGDWQGAADAAGTRGALAVLFLPEYLTLANWSARDDSRAGGPSLTVDAFREDTGRQLPTATLSVSAVAALFAGQPIGPQEIFERAVRNEPAAPFALSDRAHVRLSVAADEERLATANVIAVLEGSDPLLKHEFVAVGAHYDHLGMALHADDRGDRVYNGADDNGSGTVGVLAMAQAFARTLPRPKRSLLFVWHTGEEQGLWGSRYFVEHPTVPLGNIVAHINLDMVGRGRTAGQGRPDGPLALTAPDAVYVVGASRIAPGLAATLARANARYLGLRLDDSLDEPGDHDDIYERSDHYHYARRGIPSAFFFTGLHDDYHGLDDETDRIDIAKMRRVVQTIYAGVRALADDASFRRPDGGTGPAQ